MTLKTIKDITNALKQVYVYEEWMEEIAKDERLGVQKAWSQFQKRLQKQQILLEQYKEKCAFDIRFLPSSTGYVAGVDEAGRGPLAGPVVTAAVILPNDCEELVGLDDSKQLSAETRERFAQLVKKHAIAYAVHFQPSTEIDRLNIYEATKQSMKASVESLTVKPDFVLVDAMTLPIQIPQASIIKGDAKSLAIAAASILAKTARDDYMNQLDKQFPQYGFAKHAGYGTKQHIEALHEYGITPHHRQSFEPIKSMIK